MRTKKLYEVQVLGKNKEKKETVAALQKLGVLHITEAKSELPHFERDTSMEGVEDISLLLLQLNFIAEKTTNKRKYLLEHLPPYKQTIRRAQAFIADTIGTVERFVKQDKILADKKVLHESEMESLDKLPFNIVIPSDPNLITLLYQTTDPFDFSDTHVQKVHHTVTEDGTHYYVVTVAQDEYRVFADAIRDTPLKSIDISYIEGSSAEYKITLYKRLAAIDIQRKKIQEQLKHVIKGKERDLFVLTSALENYYAQYTITTQFQRTENFFLMRGFCELHTLEVLKKELPKATISAEPASGEAPTKFTNGVLTRPFQPITEMFSVPAYGCVDPTPLVAFFFPFFFGFMLSDIGYGLVLLVLLVILQLKYGKKMLDATKIFAVSALSSIVFGVLFGSFFGNLVPIQPLIQDSFSAAYMILIVSLIIGLIHINLGVFIKMYQMVGLRKPASRILLESTPILLIEATVALLYYEQRMLALVSATVLLFVLLKEKSLFGLMDISGFFGTWFSYARLLALSLATAGVALAINIIAEKTLLLGPLGWGLWIIIIVGGHAFNFVLNALGCTIHAARLHYVEFFSIFFEGGGYKFAPFKINNGNNHK